MIPWLQQHHKALNFIGGLFILALTVVLYFWSASKEIVVSGKSASEKRFEQSYSSANTIARSAKQKPNMSKFSDTLKKAKQGQTLLIVLMFVGLGMLLHSLYSQYKSKL